MGSHIRRFFLPAQLQTLLALESADLAPYHQLMNGHLSALIQGMALARERQIRHRGRLVREMLRHVQSDRGLAPLHCSGQIPGASDLLDDPFTLLCGLQRPSLQAHWRTRSQQTSRWVGGPDHSDHSLTRLLDFEDQKWRLHATPPHPSIDAKGHSTDQRDATFRFVQWILSVRDQNQSAFRAAKRSAWMPA